MHKRRTVVCRSDACGGGWWGEVVPERCPQCNGRLTELAVTYVSYFGSFVEPSA